MEEKIIKRPEVLTADDIQRMVKPLQGRDELTRRLMKLLAMDKVNWLHSRNYDKPDGGQVAMGMLKDLDVSLRIDNAGVLDNLPEGGFITVSNHPFGAMEGIMLVGMIASKRPDFKVMVNMILMNINAFADNFIPVDALASDDPAKKAVSMRGIKAAIMHVRRGGALGFFPAGAVSKVNRRLRIEDRQWQPNVLRLIEQLNVPVIPIYFHGHNSTWFNILGMVSWKLRTLRLPAEVFRCHGRQKHVSIGNPISVDEQKAHRDSLDEFGAFLREKTYCMRSWK